MSKLTKEQVEELQMSSQFDLVFYNDFKEGKYFTDDEYAHINYRGRRFCIPMIKETKKELNDIRIKLIREIEEKYPKNSPASS
jgi:hypothetical protein